MLIFLKALFAIIGNGTGIRKFYYPILRTLSISNCQTTLFQGEFDDTFILRESPGTVCSCSYWESLPGNDLRKEEMQKKIFVGVQWKRFKYSDKENCTRNDLQTQSEQGKAS